MNRQKILRQFNKFQCSPDGKKLLFRWTQTEMTILTAKNNIVRIFSGNDVWNLRQKVIEWIFTFNEHELSDHVGAIDEP